MNHDEREQLRQSLLELHYDLLDENEAQTLRDAMLREPEVAAEWEKVQQLAEKFTDVARLQTLDLPRVDFRGTGMDSLDSQPEHDHAPTAEASDTTRGDATIVPLGQDADDLGRGPVPLRRRRSWPLATAVAALAAMLGMLVIGSWYLERVPTAPASAIAVRAQQVPEHLAGSDHEFRVYTSRIDRAAAVGRFPVTPATLSFAVLSRGSVLFSGTIETDQEGAGRIVLPPELLIPPESTLKVTAQSLRDPVAASTIDLPLEPTRCVTHLVVDRPVYRSGETVYFRSLTLLRRSLQTASGFPIRFELQGPDGQSLDKFALEGVTEYGVGQGAFVLPVDAAAGTYTLAVHSLDGMFPDQPVTFQVRDYQAPKVAQTVQFQQRSYRPGDSVEAEIVLTRITSGEPLANAAFTATLLVNDREVHRIRLQTSADGRCTARFQLPQTITAGNGTLRIDVEADGSLESRLVPLPVETGELTVSFFPEGGDLVAGLENRVYFTAHDALGNPVHLDGELVDRSGNRIVQVETLLDGMGQFRLTPIDGEAYQLVVNIDGASQTRAYPLPESVGELPVIDTGKGVFAAGAPIELVVRAAQAQALLVRAACRGQLVAEQTVQVAAGDNTLPLPLRPETGGVVRVTILDPLAKPARPLVERLVYRRPLQRLQVEVLNAAASATYSPGDSVHLDLQVRDETGSPASAILGVAVVDEAVWSLDQQDRPSMATQFLLLSEIESPKDLEHADFYLGEGEEAERALDLLLGTQGWRRFVDWKADEAPPEFRQQLIRLLELDGSDAGAASSFDNAPTYASQWMQYQQVLDKAKGRTWMELRMLAVLVTFVWLVTFAAHRRWTRATLVGGLLLMVGSLLISGCGSSIQSSAPESAVEEHQVDSEDADGMPASESPATGAVVAEPPMSIDSAMDKAVPSLARQTAPQWLDWLDEDKVAWLLRLAGQDGPQSASDQGAEDPSRTRQSISGQELRQLMVARGLDAEAAADQLIEQLRFPVRQYAHRRPSDGNQRRADYSETIFWHPLLSTDSSGRATIRFDLPDSVTTFRLQIDGHTVQGRLGSETSQIVTAKEGERETQP